MKFSIITPTYSRPAALAKCIDSVRMQTYSNWEQLICSDGHSAADELCVNSLQDGRLIYSSVESSNVCTYGNRQRNKLIQEATGDYFIFLDDDNTIFPNYFELAMRFVSIEIGILIFKIMHNIVGIIPRQDQIHSGEFDSLNIMVRKDIAQQFAWNENEYAADYSYAKACEEYCIKNEIEIRYVNKIIGSHN